MQAPMIVLRRMQVSHHHSRSRSNTAGIERQVLSPAKSSRPTIRISNSRYKFNRHPLPQAEPPRRRRCPCRLHHPARRVDHLTSLPTVVLRHPTQRRRSFPSRVPSPCRVSPLCNGSTPTSCAAPPGPWLSDPERPRLTLPRTPPFRGGPSPDSTSTTTYPSPTRRPSRYS